MFEQITIIAPGLLGASVAMAAKDRQLCKRLSVWARRGETRVQCQEQFWCDAVYQTVEEAVVAADFIVVCSPVETIYPLVKQIASHVKEGAIVTDVGSTKSLICRRCSSVLSGAHFIGSHPMAGSEKTGLEHARIDLFQDKACFVTPLTDSNGDALEEVIKFWKALGMEIGSVSPECHDEIVANISHLPHILASCLCSYLATQDLDWRNYAGSGLLDCTRVAGGSPKLWKEIIGENREEILRALSQFENELQSFKSAIADARDFELINLLERGKNYRNRLRGV